MNRPTFFILGAKKCGTSSLYCYLGQHPDVYFSVPKEPIFFEAEYHKGLEYYWNRYFSGWEGQGAVGEARQRNLYLPYVPERIKESIPNPRFIVIVRNPIERAYSEWLKNYISGREVLSFEDAIHEDLKRIERGVTFEGEEGARIWAQRLVPVVGKKGWFTSGFRTYMDGGYYYQQIQRYIKLFPREHLRIIFLEDLSQDPQQVFSNLWSFLGVNPECVQLVDTSPQNVSPPLTVARIARNRYGAKLLELVPNRVLWLLKTFSGHSPAISPHIKKFLVSHYDEHNRNLERLTGRCLSHWNM